MKTKKRRKNFRMLPRNEISRATGPPSKEYVTPMPAWFRLHSF
jgi:hypothetical protein